MRFGTHRCLDRLCYLDPLCFLSSPRYSSRNLHLVIHSVILAIGRRGRLVGDQSASVWYQRIAGFIAVRIVFSADHMEEVAFCEAEFLGIVWIEYPIIVWSISSTNSNVVVESFNSMITRLMTCQSS